MTKLEADAIVPADPDGQNDNRSLWARKAVRTFQRATGITDADGLDTAILDLLADLGHLCDRQNLEVFHLIQRAAEHYNAETEDHDISRGPNGEQFDFLLGTVDKEDSRYPVAKCRKE